MIHNKVVGYFRLDKAARISLTETGEGADAYSNVSITIPEGVELTTEQHQKAIDYLKAQLIETTGINPDHVYQVTEEEYNDGIDPEDDGIRVI